MGEVFSVGGGESVDWGQFERRGCVEDALHLDIRYLNRRGILLGASHTIIWNRGQGRLVPLRLKALGSIVKLDFRARNPLSNEWQDQREYVGTTRTPCHYGGSRLWWSCPRCESRVANLAYLAGRFGCRHCMSLVYACQQEGQSDRSLRAAAKARKRLGETWWIKPKGMHQMTYQRLVIKSKTADMRVAKYLAGYTADLVEQLRI